MNRLRAINRAKCISECIRQCIRWRVRHSRRLHSCTHAKMYQKFLASHRASVPKSLFAGRIRLLTSPVNKISPIKSLSRKRHFQRGKLKSLVCGFFFTPRTRSNCRSECSKCSPTVALQHQPPHSGISLHSDMNFDLKYCCLDSWRSSSLTRAQR